MKTLNEIFFDYSSKINDALRYEDLLQKAKQEAELFKEEILTEPKLHEILTTVGVVHNGKLYKKIATIRNENRSYFLDIQDYIEPVQSVLLDALLDAKLGDSNE